MGLRALRCCAELRALWRLLATPVVPVPLGLGELRGVARSCVWLLFLPSRGSLCVSLFLLFVYYVKSHFRSVSWRQNSGKCPHHVDFPGHRLLHLRVQEVWGPHELRQQGGAALRRALLLPGPAALLSLPLPCAPAAAATEAPPGDALPRSLCSATGGLLLGQTCCGVSASQATRIQKGMFRLDMVPELGGIACLLALWSWPRWGQRRKGGEGCACILCDECVMFCVGFWWWKKQWDFMKVNATWIFKENNKVMGYYASRRVSSIASLL